MLGFEKANRKSAFLNDFFGKIIRKGAFLISFAGRQSGIDDFQFGMAEKHWKSRKIIREIGLLTSVTGI
jgi:hypothetical protein